MELATAIQLIQPGVETTHHQTWADLGCGEGLFTQALASILADHSIIHAVDKKLSGRIISSNKTIKILPHELDFTEFLSSSDPLDGMLMANALHFVQDKISFIELVFSKLKPAGRLIAVEYNTDVPNPWIPYPISFESLLKLSTSNNYYIKKLNEASSKYQTGGIYSALITNK